MKIGVIRRQFAKSGGAELYTQRLLLGMVARNHEPHLFAENWGHLPEGVVFHPVESSGGRSERNRLFAERVRLLTKAAKLNCTLSLDRTLHQDVYRAGDGVHRVWLERWRRYAPWWRRPFIGRSRFHRNILELERQTFDPRNTKHIIVNSEMIRNEILENFEFPPSRIHLIRNGVDTEKLTAADRLQARKRYGFRDQEFVVSFVGSGWERKGLHFVINAIQKLPPSLGVRLFVVGKGRRPFGAPSNVVFAGAIKEIDQVYAASDLFITLPIYEPSANVVYEALSAGLPVITSAFNGASELLQEGITGSVVLDPADAEAVSECLQFWITNGKTRSCAKQQRDFLDISRNVEDTLSLLQMVAE